MLNPNQQEHVEYPSTGKLLLLTVLALGFVAIGLVFIALGFSEEDAPGMLIPIGLLSVVFFGLCLVYMIYRLFNRRPSLLINEEGLTDHSSYTGGGFLRWDEIQDVFMYELMGHRFIGISLKDNEGYLARQSGMKKFLMKINRGMVKAPVNIAQTGVKLPLEVLYGMIVERWRQVEGNRTA